MKVTGNRPPGTPELNAGKAREANARQERTRPGAKEPAAAQETRTPLTLHRVREVIRATPDIRAERVQAVRDQLQAGRYRVDAERLAENLLTESLREDVDKP